MKQVKHKCPCAKTQHQVSITAQLRNTRNLLAVCMLSMQLLAISSCKKDDSIPYVDCSAPTNDQSLSTQLIKGQWDWTYETYFNRVTRKYETITPATEGYTRSIVFDKNGNAASYRNGLQEADLAYEITGLDKVTGVAGDNKITTLILYSKQTGLRTDFAPVRICTDSLRLSYDFYSDVKGREVWARKK